MVLSVVGWQLKQFDMKLDPKFSNGPGLMGGPRHGPKKQGSCSDLGTVDRAAGWPGPMDC